MSRRMRLITGWVKEKSPDPVVRMLRRLVLLTGLVTARWRVAPTFIVVGAQRSGTTSLFRVLSDHPSVMRPTQSKGILYFDLNYHRGRRWYLAHFPLAVSARFAAKGKPHVFESCGYYLFHPSAAGRIAKELPEVKIVVMVRDPIERAYSAHRHELARGFETLSFEAAIEAEESRTAGEVEKILADPTYESYEHRHHSYLARSRYSEQIQRFIDELGRNRVHVVDADRFFTEPELEFDRLRAWLDLPEWQPAKFERWNARPTESPLSPELRKRLTAYFAPYDDELADIMGRTPYWRTTAAATTE